MVALSAVPGIVAAIPSIVAGVDSVFTAISSAFGGRGAAESTFGSGEFGGAFPPVNTTGFTSVGPEVGIQQAGGLITALPRILQTGAGSAIGTAVAQQFLGDRVPLGPAPPAGGQRVTKRQAILSQARFFSPGATAKKIVRSAKQCGIELAAATFGLTVLHVCFLIAQPPTRRARGISAADLRRTRSTIRKVGNIQRDLKRLSGPIRRK